MGSFEAGVTKAVACGQNATVTGISSVAVGSAAESITSGSIAIGSGAIAGKANDYADRTRSVINQQSQLKNYNLIFSDADSLRDYVAAVQDKKNAGTRVSAAEEFVYRSTVGHNNNIAQGVGAIAEGSRNISIGEYAGGITTEVYPNSTQEREVGDNWNMQNVNIGTNAGTNSARNMSVAIGNQAGYLEPNSVAMTEQGKVRWDQRSPSTYVGNTAGKNTAAYGIIGIGSNAAAGITDIYNTGNVFIGDDAGARSNSGVGRDDSGAPLRNASGFYLRADGRLVNPQGPIIPGVNTAIGPQAFRDSSGSGNTAIGRYAMANGSVGSANTAVGEDALLAVKGDLNTAVGAGAGRVITSSSSTSVGRAAMAYGNSSVAIGSLAQAATRTADATTVVDGVAIGTEAKALSTASIAIGKRAQTGTGAGTESAIAVGSNAQALGKGSIALGSSTDVETGAHDWGFGLSKDVNIPAATRNPVASGDYGIALGTASVAGATQADINAVAIGKGAQALATNSISIGTGNKVYAARSGAIGDPTTIIAGATDSYSIGNNNTVNTADSFVMGNSVTTSVADSVYLGRGAAASSTRTPTTAGTTTYNSETINGVTYDYAGGTPVGVVSVGAVGGERRIQNVAAGLVSATSTDAINGSQLYRVAETANAGWNMTVNGADPSNVGPGQTVDFRNTDGNIRIGKAGNDLTFNLNPNLRLNSVTTGDTRIDTRGLFINGGPSVTKAGIDAAGLKVTNVADGTAPYDAVNRGQLDALDHRLSREIDKVDDRAGAGIASAMAAASVPQATIPGANLLGAGTGYYNGHSALSIGYSAMSDNGKWIIRSNFSVNSEDAAVSAGIGYQW